MEEINLAMKSKEHTLLCAKCMKPFNGKIYFLALLDSDGVPVASALGEIAISRVLSPTNDKPAFCPGCLEEIRRDAKEC
jgi:hypothetical protein